MAAYCPTCQREFDVSGGYCPHDGELLRAGRAQARSQDDTREVSAMARLQKHGIGVETGDDDYDRFLGSELDGRYKITRKLGEGGMGVVFYAEHVVIQKPVAVKILKKSVSSDPSTVKRFIQEARAASRIGHPNIVDVTDFGETADGLAYQVMEYLDGPTLADLIHTRKRVAVDEAVPIIAQMARALEAAHGKGIVHRDLKPENVFLIERHGRSDFVKIVDFGIAKVTDTGDGRNKGEPRLTRAGAVFGTPEYMAPEQASGSVDIDHRADIYSLGAIFFEMLAGVVPLVGANTVRTLAMVILEDAPTPRQVAPELELDDELEAVVMQALGKKREQRQASMGALAAQLEKLFGRRLAPRIGPGIGSLPPMPPPSGEITQQQPDTVPDVGPPDTQVGEMAKSPGRDDKPTDLYVPPRGKGDDRRRKRQSTHDPLFVETARPGYDSIEEPRISEFLTGLHRRPSRVPVIAAVVICILGGVAAAYFVHTRGGDGRAASAELDAGASAGGKDDAQRTAPPETIASAELDAGASDPAAADGGTAGRATLAPQPGTREHQPGKTPRKQPESKPRRAASGYSHIRVLTRPAEGRVFVGGIPRGPDGVTLRESIGTRLSITCKMPGYRDGLVKLKVTKADHLVTCDMDQKPRCIEGLQNPFGDCP